MGAGSSFSTPQTSLDSSNGYVNAAEKTAAGNLQNAQLATVANRVNQNTPYGSLNYTKNADGSWTANQSLSQPLQQLTDTSLSGLQYSLQNPMYGINPG